MSDILEELVVNTSTLSDKTQLDSQIQTFSGAAKQYVRSEGWLKPIKNFVSRRAKAGITTPFKYLTLPGPNMTDIGVLWNAGLIEPIDGKVNIAICDREYAEVVVAQMGQLGVELLGADKMVLHEALKAKKGPLRKLFPFDVINLDLCNALVTGTKRYSNLDALLWMFRLQRGQRFLLLLTTRANEKFDIDLVRLLEGRFANRPYENESGFRVAYETLAQQTKLDPYQDSTLFSRLVFPKLIAKYAVSFGYKVTELFAAYYSRAMGNERHYDMLAHPCLGRDWE